MVDKTPAVPAGVRRLAKVLGWLCWLGIAMTAVFGLVFLFDLMPDDWIVRESGGGQLLNISIEIADPPNAMKGLFHDLLFRIVSLAPMAIFIFALWSARTSFVGIARGDYFAPRTVLGLRNLALAVLLHMIASPILLGMAKAAYASRFEHGSITMSLGLGDSTILMLIFAGAAALISTVIAHAAKIDDENRQFV